MLQAAIKATRVGRKKNTHTHTRERVFLFIIIFFDGLRRKFAPPSRFHLLTRDRALESKKLTTACVEVDTNIAWTC